MEGQQYGTVVMHNYDMPAMALNDQAYTFVTQQGASHQPGAATSPSIMGDMSVKGKKTKSNHSNCEHKVRVRNSTYNSLKDLSSKENKAMSVIIDQLVSERISGGGQFHTSTPPHMDLDDGNGDDLPAHVPHLQAMIRQLKAEKAALAADLKQKDQDIASMMVDIAGLSAHLEQVCGVQAQHHPHPFVNYDMSAAPTYTQIGDQRPSPTSMQALGRTASGNLSDRNSPSGRVTLPSQVAQGGAEGQREVWVGSDMVYTQYGHHVAPTYDRVSLVQGDGCRSVLESAERQQGIDLQLINGSISLPALPTGTVITLAPESLALPEGGMVNAALMPQEVPEGFAQVQAAGPLGYANMAVGPAAVMAERQSSGRKRSAPDDEQQQQ